MSIAKKITGQAGIYFAGTLFSVVIGFFFKIYVTQKLGANMLGIYALGLSVVSVLSVFLSFGLGNGLVRFVSKYLAENNYVQLHTYLRKTILITLVMSLLSASLFFLFPYFIAVRLLNSTGLVPYMPYFAVLLVVNAVIALTDQTIRGLQEVRKSTVIGHFFRLPVKIAFAVFFISLGFQLKGYLWSEIIGSIGALVLFIWLLKKLLPKEMPDLVSKASSKLSREARIFGNNMLVSNTVGILQSQGDKILLAIYLSTTDLGVYSVTLTLVAFVPTVLVSVNSIFTPIISQLHTQNRMQELKKYYQFSSKYIFVLSFPLIVFLFVFNEPILNLFGNEFKTGSQLLNLLLIGQIINISTGSVGMMLNMTGLEKIGRNSSIFTATLSLLGYIICIPIFGLIGIGFVTFGAVVFQGSYSVYMLFKKQGIQPFNKAYAIIILTFFMGSVVYYISIKYLISNLAHKHWLILVLLGITYVFFISIFLITSSRKDKDFIRSLLKQTSKNETNS